MLNTNKWQVPMPRPPVCINTSPCKVCPDTDDTYPVKLAHWDNSRKVSNIEISKEWANTLVDPKENLVEWLKGDGYITKQATDFEDNKSVINQLFDIDIDKLKQFYEVEAFATNTLLFIITFYMLNIIFINPNY